MATCPGCCRWDSQRGSRPKETLTMAYAASGLARRVSSLWLVLRGVPQRFSATGTHTVPVMSQDQESSHFRPSLVGSSVFQKLYDVMMGSLWQLVEHVRLCVLTLFNSSSFNPKTVTIDRCNIHIIKSSLRSSLNPKSVKGLESSLWGQDDCCCQGGEGAGWMGTASMGDSLNSNSDLVSQIHCLPNPILPLMGACCLDASSPQPSGWGDEHNPCLAMLVCTDNP